MATHPFVLLVEPDPILRELIHGELKEQGCIVFDAAHPHEALAFAELYPGSIDLAVTDLPTWPPDDQAFIDELRALPTGTHARVLHMAGSEGSVDGDSNHTDQFYLVKPFNRQTLVDAVQAALPTDLVEAQAEYGDRAVFWGAVQAGTGAETGAAAATEVGAGAR